jgi:hypothetical protein
MVGCPVGRLRPLSLSARPRMIAIAQESVIRRSEQMRGTQKRFWTTPVEGEKALGLASRFESTHVPFPLAGRLMRNLGAIAGITLRGVSHVAQDRPQGGRVAS